jgi:AcrR family transcriptional regulator
MPSTPTQRITGAAAQLFAERGFPAVSMADIAERAGLDPGNLYRYVPGKNALLHEVLDAGLDVFTAACGADPDLEELVAALVEAATSEPTLVAAYLRERRRIDASTFPEVAHHDRALVEIVVTAIRRAQPEAADDRTVTRFRGLFGILDAITKFADELSARARSALCAGMSAVVTAPLSDVSERGAELTGWRPTRTRRQEVIDAAVSLMSEHGYDDARVTDVGRAIGISGPSVYEHFRTKQHILLAAIDRCAALLVSSTEVAFSGATGPDDALDRLVNGLSSTCVTHREMMTVTSREISALGAPDRERVGQIRDDLDDVWTAVIRERWPELPTAAAKALARSAVQMTMLATRSADSPASAEAVSSMTLSFLHVAATHGVASADVGVSTGV